MTRIYTYGVKTKGRAFYIDAQSLNRLDEFYDLNAALREVISILYDTVHNEDIKSERLKQLCYFKQIINPSADAEMEEPKKSKSKTEAKHEDY